MIVRGTTPTMTFKLPFNTNIISTCFVIIKQNKITMIEKELKDCTRNNNNLIVKLSEKDTLRLEAKVDAAINLVLKTDTGDRFESCSFVECVEDTSKDGVI